MKTHKLIIAEVLIYVIAYMIAVLVLTMWRFGSASATDNSLSRVYGEVFLIITFFVIAIVLTVVNFFLLRNSTVAWVRYLACAPMLCCVLHLLFMLRHEIIPKASLEKQRHTLTIELRTKSEWSNTKFFFRTSNVSSSKNFEMPNSMLVSAGGTRFYIQQEKAEPEWYVYQFSETIYYGSDAKFSLHSSKTNENGSYLWETLFFNSMLGTNPNRPHLLIGSPSIRLR